MANEKMDVLDYEKGMVFLGDDSRIQNCMLKAKKGEQVKLAFLGGSITQGCLSSTPETCYAYLTYQWWKEQFPEAEMTYINAGIGGTTSHLGVGRVQEDVLSYDPDFVIVEFSVNDPDEDAHFQETYEGLIRQILSWKSHPALLLVHNVRYDDGGNAEGIHRPVGAHYNLPSVSVKPVIYRAVSEGRITAREVTQDDLHPNDLGHAMVAKTITTYLEKVKERTDSLKEEPVIHSELPAPMTVNGYENARRLRNDALMPLEQKGFVKDETPQSCVADCFKKGFRAENAGDKISFEVSGASIAVQYRKTVRRPAPVARLILDGDHEHSVELDGNFTEEWGDCLYLETVMEHGTPGKHFVEIEIAESPEDRKEDFYLVSLIVAD